MAKIKHIALETQDLAEYQKLNVKAEDIADDFFDYSKVVVKKPWGYEYLLYSNQETAVWILYIMAGAQTSMHCHPNKKTSLIVLQGEVQCSSLKNEHALKAGEGLLIEKGVFHQTCVQASEGAFVMEVETPVNKRDLVRLRDKYGRQGQGYETAEHHSVNTQNYNYLSFNKQAGNQPSQNLQAEVAMRKRLGQCSITIFKINNLADLKQLNALNTEDILCITKGKFESTNLALNIGDSISSKEFFKLENLKLETASEILVVRKIDNLVKFSDQVAIFLRNQNIRDVFLVPGDANVHLMDSIGRAEGLRFTALASEREASLAAEAYAKTAQKLAVLVVSSGGSGPNTLPGVCNAWIDSTPILIISGQARSDQDFDSATRQLGNKALNIIELVKPITKYAVKLSDPLMLQFELEKACQIALEGRQGPVWIDLPIDFQGMQIDSAELKSFTAESGKSLATNQDLLSQKIEQLKVLLKNSKRPVILAGNGIRLSAAENKFLEMINFLEIPVLLSRRGADLLEDQHALCFGRPGTFGQRRSNLILQNADLIISIGSRLSIPLVGRNTLSFGRGAKKVVVDIDSAELQKNTIKIDLAIEASAKDFIEQILQQKNEFKLDFSAWLKTCHKLTTNFDPKAEKYPQTSQINPYNFISQLSAALSEDSCLVVDGGAVMHRTMQVFGFKARQRLISSTGLELPGFALAGAIGASVARKRSKVICLCEDRGFQTSIAALQTIVDNNLPICIFVLKSRGHTAIRNIQKDFFGARFVATDNELLFNSPSVAQIAKVYGYQTYQIDQTDFEQIRAQIDQVLKLEGPVVCEVFVDSEFELIPRMGFTIKNDGKWIAKPLEDMYPFLDREILKQNMLIDILAED